MNPVANSIKWKYKGPYNVNEKPIYVLIMYFYINHNTLTQATKAMHLKNNSLDSQVFCMLPANCINDIIYLALF